MAPEEHALPWTDARVADGVLDESVGAIERPTASRTNQVLSDGEAGLAGLLGGDDQDRPVPQVEGVGALPQPLGGAGPEERLRPPPGDGHPPGDDQGGADHRDCHQ